MEEKNRMMKLPMRGFWLYMTNEADERYRKMFMDCITFAINVKWMEQHKNIEAYTAIWQFGDLLNPEPKVGDGTVDDYELLLMAERAEEAAEACQCFVSQCTPKEAKEEYGMDATVFACFRRLCLEIQELSVTELIGGYRDVMRTEVEIVKNADFGTLEGHAGTFSVLYGLEKHYLDVLEEQRDVDFTTYLCKIGRESEEGEVCFRYKCNPAYNPVTTLNVLTDVILHEKFWEKAQEERMKKGKPREDDSGKSCFVRFFGEDIYEKLADAAATYHDINRELWHCKTDRSMIGKTEPENFREIEMEL